MEIRSEFIGLIIAGVQPSSLLISFTLATLAKSAHLEKKVFEEIDSLIRNTIFQSKHIFQLTYLNSFIMVLRWGKCYFQETCRYFSIIPSTCVTNLEEIQVKGFKIPIHSKWNISFIAISQNEELYPGFKSIFFVNNENLTFSILKGF